MQTLDLDIKNTVLINLDTSIFQNKILADFLRIRLNCKQLIQNLLVILESKQLFSAHLHFSCIHLRSEKRYILQEAGCNTLTSGGK